ncbi:hypothetical protein CWATWH0402_3294 [Crocosphaera watsonii WH 0402]|uniref:Uncharacterized protein n=1 Tax=Crocosphaera watsonii WH 0402 TaxID=1284629 RepID=T2K034_CROWT|nr:hypothetical protein CWATWH0402_3294 [Crocosphaera watsonii WH 0402]
MVRKTILTVALIPPEWGFTIEEGSISSHKTKTTVTIP